MCAFYPLAKRLQAAEKAPARHMNISVLCSECRCCPVFRSKAAHTANIACCFNIRIARDTRIVRDPRTASAAAPCLSTSTTDFRTPCACTIASDWGTLTTFFAHGFLPSHSMNDVHMRKRFQPLTTMTTGASCSLFRP